MKFKVKDIAHDLGLSTSTVSMALRGKSNISQATKQRIFDYIEKNGGDLNSYLREESFHTGNLMVVLYKKGGEALNDASPFWTSMVENLQIESMKSGYVMLVVVHDAAQFPNSRLLHQIESANVRGIVVIASEMNQDDIAVFEQLSVPKVYIDNSFKGLQTSFITVDGEKLMSMAMERFARAGHKRVGYFRSNKATDPFNNRKIWFDYYAAYYGLDICQDDIVSVPLLTDEAVKVITEYINKRSELPTAFYADIDQIAIGAYYAFQKKGMQVGTDVSLIAFGNHPMGEMVEPKLTSFNLNKKDVAVMALYVLQMKINNVLEEQTAIYVTPKLIERASVKEIFV